MMRDAAVFEVESQLSCIIMMKSSQLSCIIMMKSSLSSMVTPNSVTCFADGTIIVPNGNVCWVIHVSEYNGLEFRWIGLHHVYLEPIHSHFRFLWKSVYSILLSVTYDGDGIVICVVVKWASGYRGIYIVHEDVEEYRPQDRPMGDAFV